MRVLFFYSHPFNPLNGGIERVTDTLAHVFINRGFEVFYLCGHVDEEHLQFTMPVNRHYTLPYEGFFASDANIRFFKDLIREQRIDVVINQAGMWSYPNPILGLEGAKYVSVIHSMPSAEIVKQRYMYLSMPSCRLSRLKWLLKRLLYPIYGMYLNHKTKEQVKDHYRSLVKISDRVVLLSSGYIKELNDLIGISADRLRSINNPNTFPLKQIDFTQKNKTILYVGRLDPIFKQPIVLLKIWKMLFREFPDWKLQFVGCGIAENEMKDYVQRYAIDRVFFEGSQVDVNSYFLQASIICIVSNCEGWPMALTEGMSYGCVPITFDSFVASRDIIDDGINGFLITAFSLDEYAQRLRFLMSDSIIRNNMAKAAQVKVESFAVEGIAERWIDLFSEL